MSFGTFQLPPNTFSQADLEASNTRPVYVAVAVGFVLATGAVILRLVARRKSRATLGWDDYTIIFALFLLYALNISMLLPAVKYGLGRHLPAVISTVVQFQIAGLVGLVFWLAAAAATKASLLLLYYRLFSPSKRFRVAVRIGAAVVFCQWFSLTFATIFQCRPVAAFWDRSIQGARCIDLPRLSISSGMLNLLTDVLILCLPIPMIWGLHTTSAQKVTLTGMFLLGIFVCVISIVRLCIISRVNYSDPTWRLVDVYLWTSLEDAVGITSACLPTMRPLFGRLIPGTSRVEPYNNKISRSSSRRAAKDHFDRLFEQSGSEAEFQSVTKEGEGAWTSPDLATSNELFSMHETPTRPLHSLSSPSRREDQHYPARRANNE